MESGEKDIPLEIMQPTRPDTPENKRERRWLPPIVNGEILPVLDGEHFAETSFFKPRSSENRVKLWSKYHSGCISKSPGHFDFGRTSKKKLVSYKNGVEVMNFLEKNKAFLETYVVESVPMEELERWFFRKIKHNYIDVRATGHTKFMRFLHKENYTKPSFMDLINIEENDLSEHGVVWELAKTISSSVGVDAYRIYKVYMDHPHFVQLFKMDSKNLHETGYTSDFDLADLEQVILLLEVARKMTCVRFSRHEDPLRFPDTPSYLFKLFKGKQVKEANHILYQPIIISSGKTGYVIEMWRVRDRFRERDEEISSNYMLWGSMALHYCNMYLDKKKERSMSDFLLDVVKAIFEEMVSLDQLIKRILEFAQKLVHADRASLFLVDYKSLELVSTVFDLKFESGQDRDIEKKVIRMPINRGIAGHVALSGETMNIPNAYADHRFNREVDEATGYKTVSILCMPIKVEGKVIGVVQMVNKRNDAKFGRDDEMSFEIFSTFFGLALHHARLYDRIMRKEQKYKVALEVLSYHNTCKEKEARALLVDIDKFFYILNDYSLDPYNLDEFQKCKAVIRMFDELFGMTNFDIMTFTRFVLTVKKNYRTVPYHNFDHGWSVAHAMYVILKNDYLKRFDYRRRLALFVASLCHDLDHRGYTNKYMSETASPLAAMYTTSTLEHHHFNITVTILQQDGHNIFAHNSSEEYKETLGYIRQAILATDLAAFFPNLDKMKELLNSDPEDEFSWEIPSHKDLAMAISMTAADLSASAKPWDVQIKTVKVIFEEFYDQGDKERAAGKTPIPMMDRHKPHEQPASQVGFLSQICIPCYTMLVEILPSTMPMFEMAQYNLDKWKSKADRIKAIENIESLDQIQDSISDEENAILTVDDYKKKQIKEELKDIAISEEPKAVKHSTETGNQSREQWKNSNTISWEEEEESIPDAIAESERLNDGFWKESDGTSWIDDEGVVVQSNILKVVIHNDNYEDVGESSSEQKCKEN